MVDTKNDNNNKNKKIMIIDDDKDITNLFSIFLNNYLTNLFYEGKWNWVPWYKVPINYTGTSDGIGTHSGTNLYPCGRRRGA